MMMMMKTMTNIMMTRMKVALAMTAQRVAAEANHRSMARGPLAEVGRKGRPELLAIPNAIQLMIATPGTTRGLEEGNCTVSMAAQSLKAKKAVSSNAQR